VIGRKQQNIEQQINRTAEAIRNDRTREHFVKQFIITSAVLLFDVLLFSCLFQLP